MPDRHGSVFVRLLVATLPTITVIIYDIDDKW